VVAVFCFSIAALGIKGNSKKRKEKPQ